MGLKGRSEQQPDMVVFSLKIENFGGLGPAASKAKIRNA